MGIAGCGRIVYINGRKIEPAETNVAWATWFLEDNQVKTWIVNSVSPEIQPLILRKRTARDMWVILEQMYGQKKKIIRVYQLTKDVYSLRQGEHSVADFYATLKCKWEELDYYSDDTWDCPQDQVRHLAKEWENRVFLFLAGLNDDFEGIRSQILNSDRLPSVEEVYSRVEAEEQRRLVITEKKGDHISYNERSALVSRGPVGAGRPPRKCTHCKKTGHTMDFCWDLHPEKKNSRGKPSSGKKSTSDATNSSGGKASISAEQIRELRASLSQIDAGQVEVSDDVKLLSLVAFAVDSSAVPTNRADVEVFKTENIPVEVTTIRLTKDNYLRWSAVIIMEIVGWGRISYVNRKKTEPPEVSSTWDMWFLEDNQVKTWIVNSVSSNIQPLILRKKTARDMWVILEQMYGQKKKDDSMMTECIKSQILNSEDMVSIEDVYSRIEAEEQHHLVMTGKERARSSCSEW
ncbi:hypothetical protein EJ110_NYTH29198 [Nymphaea thermarum]|nr:hypothetical protein EJ110_NYTH29198 [Nymphaea thermarum]